MKQLLSSSPRPRARRRALAHNGNDHVRGVVTAVSAQSSPSSWRQEREDARHQRETEFDNAGKPGHLADIKVGDRVVIDVPSTAPTRC